MAENSRKDILSCVRTSEDMSLIDMFQANEPVDSKKMQGPSFFLETFSPNRPRKETGALEAAPGM